MIVIMLILAGLVLASCASMPDENDDEKRWSDEPRRGLIDPDAGE